VQCHATPLRNHSLSIIVQRNTTLSAYTNLILDHRTDVTLTVPVPSHGSVRHLHVHSSTLDHCVALPFNVLTLCTDSKINIQCPFRAMDEFDIYMDSVNRKASMKQVRSATLCD
jgi:hypothetical protein